MKNSASLESCAQEMKSRGFDAHTWSNGPHFAYPVHDHPYDKLILVLEGSIRFDMPRDGTSHPMSAGDRLAIPAHTPHSAFVGAQGVTCLEGQQARENASRRVRE